jgi:hypothetical protein
MVDLTDSCWDEVSALADKFKLNRSEVIEIIARQAKENGDDLIEERYTLLA